MLQFNEQADGSKIYLSIGQEFKVILHENPSTGFRWNPIARGESVCKLLDDAFELDDDTIGNGGSHSWLFQAVKEGSGKVEFVYGRSWEHDESPARTFRLNVNVRA